MARQSKNNSAAYRTVNVCLILILAYSSFIIAAFLRAKAAVCSTTSWGVDLSIAVSLPTITITGIRGYLVIRQRSKSLQTISPSAAAPRLEAACAVAVQSLALAWVFLAGVNVLVAVRAPICLNQPLTAWQKDLKEQNWRFGTSCRLHRGLVALSVLLALSMICLSCLDTNKQQQSRRGTSLVSCYFTCRKPVGDHDSAQSMSSGRSGSSFGKDSLYLIPERRSSRSEMEHWPRRNSLSSQKAIYPHRYQWYDQRPRYASYSLPPSRYSSTLRSVSEGHDTESSDRNSSMSSSQSGKTWATVNSTRPSTTSSLPRSRAGSNPERGDLRREREGEPSSGTGVPAIPPIPTPPPPAWAPTLQHTPLSADPTLRALSTGNASKPALPLSKSSPNLVIEPLKVKKRDSSTPALIAPQAATKKASAKDTISTSPRKRAVPPMPSGPPPPVRPPRPALPSQVPSAPAVPARAPGHSAKPSITTFPVDASTRPALSTTLSSTSSNHNLRRPDPIRPRQHHHHQSPDATANGPALSQTQLHLQQYQHQRVWRHQGARNPSVYSVSSYGTHATDARTSVMTRGSRACSVGRPGTSGRV